MDNLIQMLAGLRGLRGTSVSLATPAEFSAWLQATANKLYQEAVAGGTPEAWAKQQAQDYIAQQSAAYAQMQEQAKTQLATSSPKPGTLAGLPPWAILLGGAALLGAAFWTLSKPR